MVHLKDNDIVHEDGELVEYGSGKKGKKPEHTQAEKQEWYSGFLTLAAERKKDKTWAVERFRAKFKEFPGGLNSVPGPTSEQILSYDRYMRIRYIKGKQKSEKGVAA